MNPEKMTDEDLEHELSQALSASRAAKVRAHIAALTAERDDLRAASREILVLRERVQALEAEVGAQKAWMTDARAREAQLEGALEGARSARHDAESLLAAIRQRAGDADGLAGFIRDWEKDQDGGEWELERLARAVARYVVGEDGTGAETKPEHAHSYMAGCNASCPPPEPSTAEPSTAEAFATVRGEPLFNGFSARGKAALSLLERRMGAQDAAIRQVHAELVPIAAEHHSHTGAGPQEECEWYSCEHERVLRSALTDAPPVFTLEEVGTAIRDALSGSIVSGEALARRVVESLAALRKG